MKTIIQNESYEMLRSYALIWAYTSFGLDGYVGKWAFSAFYNKKVNEKCVNQAKYSYEKVASLIAYV